MDNPVGQYNRFQTRMLQQRTRIERFTKAEAVLVLKLTALRANNLADLSEIKKDAALARKKLKVPSGDITSPAVVAFVNTWKESPETIKTAAITNAVVKYAEAL